MSHTVARLTGKITLVVTTHLGIPPPPLQPLGSRFLPVPLERQLGVRKSDNDKDRAFAHTRQCQRGVVVRVHVNARTASQAVNLYSQQQITEDKRQGFQPKKKESQEGTVYILCARKKQNNQTSGNDGLPRSARRIGNDKRQGSPVH